MQAQLDALPPEQRAQAEEAMRAIARMTPDERQPWPTPTPAPGSKSWR